MNELIAFTPLVTILLPVWLLLRKLRRVITPILLIGLLGSCASLSNEFEKSPCACSFERINASAQGGLSYV